MLCFDFIKRNPNRLAYRAIGQEPRITPHS